VEISELSRISPNISKSAFERAEERIKKNNPEVYAAYMKLNEVSGYSNLGYDDKLIICKDRAESYNRRKGSLNTRRDKDGNIRPGWDYDCPICQNRGNYAYYVDKPQGNDDTGETPRVNYAFCSCMDIRENKVRAEASGLGHKADVYTFDRFDDDEDWKLMIKLSAQSYVKRPQGWFFVGGSPGTGKTHICTAITSELIKKGHKARWVQWVDTVTRLKQIKTDSYEYGREIQSLKSYPVLYIDDFFKPKGLQDKGPTEADIDIAFDVLNFRYNADLPTIISSERMTDELVRLDEATGSRIVEKAKYHKFDIAGGPDRNYRFKE